jgi:hypothetical protein
VLTWSKRHGNLILQVILFLTGIAGGIYVSMSPANSLMRWYNIDDAFYYYKVAQNVLAGHGFTFDQIHLTNGFHPLWMVVCLGIFWLSEINLLLPLRVLVLVSALFNAFTGILFFRLLSRALLVRTAFIGAITWMLLPVIYGTVIVHGMEAAISAFFITAYLLATADVLIRDNDQPVKKTQIVMVGLLGGLTILSRLDNVFLVAVVGIFLLFRIRKIKTVLFLDLVAIALSGFLSWTLRLGINNIAISEYSVYPMLIVTFLVKPLSFYFAGLYGTREKLNPIQIITRIVIASSVTSIFTLGLFVTLYKLDLIATLSKSVLLIDAVITFLFVTVLHLWSKQTILIASLSPLQIFKLWVRNTRARLLSEGLLFALPIGILLGGYVTINKLAFGTFMPVSGQIKQWWNTLPNTIYAHKNTLLTVLGLSPSQGYGPWSLVTSQFDDLAKFVNHLFKLGGNSVITALFIFSLLLAIIIVVRILMANKGRLGRISFQLLIPAVVIGATFQIGYYATVGYQHTRSWYWVAEMIGIVLLGSVLLEGLFTWLDRNKLFRIVSVMLTFGLVLYIGSLHVRYIDQLIPMRVKPESQAEYLGEIRQLEEFTEEGSLIGMTGGGSVAYFLEHRTIVNLDGLINSAAYFHALKTGTARDFLDALPLDYVYGKEYVLLESSPYNQIFGDRLDIIGTIRGPENFILFNYVVNK